jgi:ubiquinol-cytochrome c reductase cytochrome c subunit
VKAALAAASLLALAGCSYFHAPPGPYRPPGLAHPPGATTGQALFLRDCAWCHGNTAQGTNRAPSLVTGTNGAAFTDFELRTGRMPLINPSEPVRHRAPFYDAKQIDAIVSYVASLGGKGPAVPSPNPSAGDLALGADLYQANCAACHSTTGVGGAMPPWPGDLPPRPHAKGRFVAPRITRASPREIEEALLVGPGEMPVFGRDVFDQHQIDSIVSYVQTLQKPYDHGGAGIGHIGPVAEGAIAWIVGLGLIVLLVRVIGTKAGQYG